MNTIPIGNAISRRTWKLWNNLRNWVRVRSGLPPIGKIRR